MVLDQVEGISSNHQNEKKLESSAHSTFEIVDGDDEIGPVFSSSGKGTAQKLDTVRRSAEGLPSYVVSDSYSIGNLTKTAEPIDHRRQQSDLSHLKPSNDTPVDLNMKRADSLSPTPLSEDKMDEAAKSSSPFDMSANDSYATQRKKYFLEQSVAMNDGMDHQSSSKVEVKGREDGQQSFVGSDGDSNQQLLPPYTGIADKSAIHPASQASSLVTQTSQICTSDSPVSLRKNISYPAVPELYDGTKAAAPWSPARESEASPNVFPPQPDRIKHYGKHHTSPISHHLHHQNTFSTFNLFPGQSTSHSSSSPSHGSSATHGRGSGTTKPYNHPNFQPTSLQPPTVRNFVSSSSYYPTSLWNGDILSKSSHAPTSMKTSLSNTTNRSVPTGPSASSPNTAPLDVSLKERGAPKRSDQSFQRVQPSSRSNSFSAESLLSKSEDQRSLHKEISSRDGHSLSVHNPAFERFDTYNKPKTAASISSSSVSHHSDIFPSSQSFSAFRSHGHNSLASAMHQDPSFSFRLTQSAALHPESSVSKASHSHPSLQYPLLLSRPSAQDQMLSGSAYLSESHQRHNHSSSNPHTDLQKYPDRGDHRLPYDKASELTSSSGPHALKSKKSRQTAHHPEIPNSSPYQFSSNPYLQTRNEQHTAVDVFHSPHALHKTVNAPFSIPFQNTRFPNFSPHTPQGFVPSSQSISSGPRFNINNIFKENTSTESFKLGTPQHSSVYSPKTAPLYHNPMSINHLLGNGTPAFDMNRPAPSVTSFTSPHPTFPSFHHGLEFPVPDS